MNEAYSDIAGKCFEYWLQGENSWLIGRDLYKVEDPHWAGTAPTECPHDNPEMDGALCYPQCKDGYDGVGPVCWEQCAGNEIDDGATCRIPLITETKDSYGRGAGVARSSCGDKQNTGGLCYPYCA